jgi:predicted AlkP superfamily pyrophosphatase or phosphodiesterase
LLARPLAAPAPPRLVVIIVVDQMRADYVERFQFQWTRGLRRLIDRGAWFTNAAFPYLTTVTCAGHATIATGALPRTHGVFQNAWYDRAARRLVTCTEDPTAEVLSYRSAATPGASATPAASLPGESGARLRVPTLADVLREQRGAKVVTLALKARSAVMLAGHGGDAVTWLDESLDSWTTSTAFSAAPVTAVQAFLVGNSPDIDFGRIWTRLLPPNAYGGADAGRGETPPKGWTARFPHALTGSGAGPDEDFREQWVHSPFADAYVGRLAAATAESFQLGQGTTTDFLGVGFSAPDLVGHSFGPRSHEVQDLYLHLDRTLGELFDRLDRLAGRDGWVVALTGDHGVATLPEQAPPGAAGRVSTVRLAGVVERELRTALGSGTTVSYVARITGNDVYFAPGVYDRLGATPTLAAVIQLLESQPGIARVFRRDELAAAAASHDRLRRAAALSYVPEYSGDLVMTLKPGWTFAATGVTHGTGNPDDQRVPILLMGPGIKRGRYGAPVTPADIAPTLAALTGVIMQHAEGGVLRAALTGAPAAMRKRDTR